MQARTLEPLPATGGASWQSTLLDGARSGLDALRTHKLRAALTMVGIVVGICGVMLVSAFSGFAQNMMRAQAANLGANLVNVEVTPPGANGVPQTSGAMTLTEDDARAVRQLPHVIAVTPRRLAAAQLVAGANNWRTAVWGVYPDIQNIQGYTVSRGAFFTMQDNAAVSPVAVIGQTIVDKLFPGADPLGQTMRIATTDFRVVGVLTPRGSNGERDEDDIIFVPFATGEQRLVGAALKSNFGAMWVQADQPGNVQGLADGVKRTLEQQHHIPPGTPDGFSVKSNVAALSKDAQDVAIIKTVMSTISGVALLMGGIGLATIMLASVTERTREIGVRMAVGAKASDVLVQFLIEAAAVSLAGGVIGVMAGYGVALELGHLIKALEKLHAVPAPSAAPLALAAAVLIGLLFGLYPARRAARLQPVDALRHA